MYQIFIHFIYGWDRGYQKYFTIFRGNEEF